MRWSPSKVTMPEGPSTLGPCNGTQSCSQSSEYFVQFFWLFSVGGGGDSE